MIDLHCHILPRLDDGARDLDDSLAMARQAAADGIGLICATPHIRHDHDVVIGELRQRVAALNTELVAREIPVLVEPGGEVAETALDALEPEELRAVSLCGTGRWVLLEPAPGPLSEGLEAAVGTLRQRGASAVIAHPERHWSDDLADRLQSLAGAGALIQVTAAALEDPPSEPPLLALAGRGLVHLVASDSHSARAGRPPTLTGALRRLERVPALRGHLDWVTRQAPEAIVRGESVTPPFEPA